ncbi:hypothetical protein [Pluralibacter gergoviae]|uniref:hypothetical protein n=1 Tax=Pluralibacter gergoviae TaxID=61647 RepID=UPI000651F72A|nr:hypothetical protein [Pluralibacter gergoviae]KMK09328.1 hypothetical protein ABW07_08710 [Pluralibacter gergoviae]
MNSPDEKSRNVKIEKTEQQEFRESFPSLQPLFLLLTAIIFVFAVYIIFQKLSSGGAAPDVGFAVLCAAGAMVVFCAAYVLLKNRVASAYHHFMHHSPHH